MNRLRKIVATLALIALFPWNAALALPDAPVSPSCAFNGSVNATKVMPDGTIYVGGSFTNISCDGGMSNYAASNVAKILPNGQFDTTWDNKGVNGSVFAVEADATRLYVGGLFNEVIGNGVNYGYENIAALELATGYADTSFMEEDIGAGTNGQVNVIINNTYENGIIIGGSFTTVSDSFVTMNHAGIGFLANDGLVIQSMAHLEFVGFGQYVNALVLDGSRLYVGGSFKTVNWDAGTELRRNVASLDLSKDASADSTLVDTNFDPDLDNEVKAMALDTDNGRIFLGGSFIQAKTSTTQINTYYLHPFFTTTGEPDLIYGVWPDASVSSLSLSNGELFVGGLFANVFGSGRSYVASLDVDDVAVSLTSWDPSANADVIAIDVEGNIGAMGGNFTDVHAVPVQGFARFETPPAPSTSISGTVFEDVNFGLNAGRSKTTAYGNGGLPVMGATVEFYDGDTLNYLASVVTNPLGDYTWTAPGPGDYIVRVVDGSVLTGRNFNLPASGLMPVTTFVTSGGVQVTNRVGGAVPNMAEAPANNGSQTFADLVNGGESPQTFGLVDVTGDMTDIDFGYNFNLVVNTNDAGRGSLRSAIANTNALSNTGLVQNGYAGGTENIVFRIPNGTNSMGMNAANDYFNGVQSAAIITLNSPLPDVQESLRLDGLTQPSFPANTSTPIVLDSNFQLYGLHFLAAENHVRGFAFVNANYASLGFLGGTNEITGNIFGVYPNDTLASFSTYGLLFENDAAGDGNTIGSPDEQNVFAYLGNSAIYFMGRSDNTVVQSNYFGLLPDGLTTSYCYDAINFGTGGTDVLIGGNDPSLGNVFGGCFNYAIRQWSGSDVMERLVIMGNSFGTDITGMVSTVVSNPLALTNAIDLKIGGNAPGEGNLFVSGNNPMIIEHSTGARVYGNDFGLYADDITPAPYSTYRSMLFLYSSTDTEIGDGTADGTNVFADGMGGIEFSDYGSITHYNVRIKGNKVGVDRTGMVPFSLNSNFQLSQIDGLQIGGLNPGEGNQAVTMSSTPFTINSVNNIGIYGNICNANADVSAALQTTYTDCFSLYHTQNVQVGAPGAGRNYLSAINSSLSIGASEQITIQNNYFNLNASGSAPLLQTSLRGVAISNSTNTLIGGINPGEGNFFGPHMGSLLIGDLGMAIDIQSNNGVWVQGNIIGSDATGTKPFESDFGIGISGIFDPTQNIVIGGNTPAHGNIIFGGFGVLLYGGVASGILIQNNSIGVNSLGVATSSGAMMTPLPFTLLKPAGIGIIWGAHDNIIEENIIGGTPSYIAGTGPGIYVAQDQNSPFGLQPVPFGNRITKNEFRSNAGPSIDLENTITGFGGDGVSANDGITDPTRAHYGLDYPIITSSTLVGGNLYVEGFVGSGNGLSAFADVEVEIYEQANDGNQNGEVVVGDGLSLPHGEGYLYLGTIMTSSIGGDFIGVVPAPFLASASSITAIAIDSLGNTSEFGLYFDGVVPPVIPPAPTPVPQGGTGGLACNMSDPKNPGNGCQTLGQLPIFGLTTSSLPQISIVPDVPMPWLNGTTSTVTAPAICKPLINKYLKFGGKNDAEQVKLLQQFLKEKDGSYKGAVNGVFDKATDTAVRAFQKKYAKDVLEPWGHKTPTGYVYITTSRKINALNCQR